MASNDKTKNEPELGRVPIEPDDLEALERARRAGIDHAQRLEGIRAALRGMMLGFTTVMVCFGLYWGVKYAVALPYFNITKLVVVGDTNKVPPQRLKEVIEPAVHGNFFTIDMSAVRDAAERVPWIKGVSVRRVWPNEMIVRFSTRQAVAIFEDGRLVDAAGELFIGNPDEQEPGDSPLPSFYGTPAQIPQIVQYYRDFSRAVQPLGVTVTDVWLSDRGSWSLSVSSASIPATKIDLGQDRGATDGVMDKLVNVVAAYPSIRELLQGPPASIDARYNNAFSASLPNKENQAPAAQELDVPEGNPDEDPVGDLINSAVGTSGNAASP